jgi:hypothetical protein
MATKSAKPPITKYRPVLSALQIDKILTLCKAEVPMEDITITLIANLSIFKAKIDNAAITPAYKVQPQLTSSDVLESLGGSALANSLESLPAMPSVSIISTDTVTKEEYWLQCYNKYIQSPTYCSLEEIAASNEHKYLHNLMTPEEVTIFESRMLQGDSNV